jgi:xylulokinase
MILGIDVGTGGTRAVLVSEDGAVLASATSEHAPFTSPETAWAEQEPVDWWRAAQEAISAVIAASGIDAFQIRGIGLTGQMHGAVLLDEHGAVLRPAIIWCDQRTDEQCAWITEKVGAKHLLELTCNPALTNFTLTKLLWVRQHEPEIWKKVRHVLLPKDYVRFRLSGEYAIDVADASGTLMLDVTHRRWSEELLGIVDIDKALLPKVFESPEICAKVSPQAEALTGIPAGTPIVAGAGDQAAGAIGMGITRPGAVSVTLGTSGVVFAATDEPSLDPGGRLHTFCHAIPGRWHVMGVTQAAGLSLRWIRDQFCQPGYDYAELSKEAAAVPPGCDGVLWAPYLMGERTPHLDSSVRAALVGLAASHTRGHVARAVMEGVAFSQRDSFTIFAELGVPVNKVRVTGGGARSKLWKQIQADVYGHAVETIAADEGGAYGAALLAGVGTGVWPSVDEACDKYVHTDEVVTPNTHNKAIMDKQYARYSRIYPALKAIYKS